MANKLLLGTSFADSMGTSPPAVEWVWDGEKYNLLTAAAVDPARLTYIGSHVDGDLFAGTLAISGLGAATVDLQFVNGATVIQTWALTGQTSVAVSIAAQTGQFKLVRSGLTDEYPSIVLTPTADPAPGPTPLVDMDCEEHGRTTRIYASGYDRARVHVARLVRGEKRCLVVDFNGAIGASRSIVSATWRSWGQAVLSVAAISGRTTRCTLTASTGGRVKCSVTLDNGETYVQVIDLCVSSGPWFEGETWAIAGSKELTVTA